MNKLSVQQLLALKEKIINEQLPQIEKLLKLKTPFLKFCKDLVLVHYYRYNPYGTEFNTEDSEIQIEIEWKICGKMKNCTAVTNGEYNDSGSCLQEHDKDFYWSSHGIIRECSAVTNGDHNDSDSIVQEHDKDFYRNSKKQNKIMCEIAEKISKYMASFFFI